MKRKISREVFALPCSVDNKDGFTLIELLIVISIIAILTGAVVIAISPGERLASARDATRERHVQAIENALYMYYYDHLSFPDIPEGFNEICDISKEDPECENLVDLSMLTPDYMSSLPSDPRGGIDENGTGYKITVRENEKVAIYAPLSEVLTASTGGLPGYYWSFDDTLVSSEGIEPEPGYVATLRPGEGKFGGAVAVEEGTENLVENAIFEGNGSVPESWSKTGSAQSWLSESVLESDVQAWEYETESSDGPTDNRARIRQSVTLEPNTWYTASAYVEYYRCNSGNFPVVFVRDADIIEGKGGFGVSSIEDLKVISEEIYSPERISVSFKTGEGGSAYIEAGSPHTSSDGRLKISRIQLEKKPFATSFTEDSRESGRLEFNVKDVLNLEEGSLSFWFRSNGVFRTEGSYDNMFRTRSDSFLILRRYDRETNPFTGIIVFWSGNWPHAHDLPAEENEWAFINFTWKQEGDYVVFVNGEIAITGETPIFERDAERLYFSQYFNGLIDEMRVTPHALSQKEIQSLYSRGRHKYLAEKE